MFTMPSWYMPSWCMPSWCMPSWYMPSWYMPSWCMPSWCMPIEDLDTCLRTKPTSALMKYLRQKCQIVNIILYKSIYRCILTQWSLSSEAHRVICGRMRMRSPSCHKVDSYSVTFTDMKLFSDIKVTTVIYQSVN